MSVPFIAGTFLNAMHGHGLRRGGPRHQRDGRSGRCRLAEIPLQTRRASLPPRAPAQYTWNHAINSDWNNPFNWAPFGIGTPNSPNAMVQFDGLGLGPVNISASIQS